jgi:hypothetical protein
MLQQFTEKNLRRQTLAAGEQLELLPGYAFLR